MRLKNNGFEVYIKVDTATKILTLEQLPRTVEKWRDSWDRCVHRPRGEYFKGNIFKRRVTQRMYLLKIKSRHVLGNFFPDVYFYR